MNKHRRVRTAFAALLLLFASRMYSQSGESGNYVLDAQIVSPTAAIHFPFEVLLLRESLQPIDSRIVTPQEHFKFRGLRGGTYTIAAKVPGFKPVEHRVDVSGFRSETLVTIILELETPSPPPEPLRFIPDNDVATVQELAMQTPRLRQDFNDAEAALGRGDLGTAEELLQKVLKEAPNFYSARIAMGMTYQEAGRYREGEAEYRLALEARPESAGPWISLGSLYLEEAALGMDSGDNHRARGILNEALGCLLHAVEAEPNSSFAHYLLGVTYYWAGFYEESESSLFRSLDLRPYVGVARLVLANVYARMQEWPSARTQLDTYLEENPAASNRSQVKAMRREVESRLDQEECDAGRAECGYELTP